MNFFRHLATPYCRGPLRPSGALPPPNDTATISPLTDVREEVPDTPPSPRLPTFPDDLTPCGVCGTNTVLWGFHLDPFGTGSGANIGECYTCDLYHWELESGDIMYD